MDLRVGTWVEVRPLDEVLATLDDSGALDGMPFMAEMAQFCGRRFQVFKSAHKTCDTAYSFRGRSVETAVHLAELRCDGGFHGGCQASCLLFWKEAWLRPAGGPGEHEAAAETAADHEGLATLARQARVEGMPAGELRYRCQATELLRATRPLSALDPRHYWRDLVTGNLTWSTLLRGAGYALIDKLQRLLIAWRGGREAEPAAARLDLRGGELVEIRSKAEIMATLEDGVHNRGLSFDGEMAQYCGRTARVLRRVERILDEKTGRMLRLRKDCIMLEGVVCTGLRCGIRRLGCPKNVHSFWREAWLRRSDGEPQPADD